MFINEQRLEGAHITLEPLHAGHIEALKQAVTEGQGWDVWWLDMTQVALNQRGVGLRPRAQGNVGLLVADILDIVVELDG